MSDLLLKKSLRLLSLVVFSIFFQLFSVQQMKGQAAILALLFGDKVASEDFNISLELGFNLAKMSNMPDYDGRKNDVNFGVAGNIKLSEKFYFSPTAYFLSGRTFKIKNASLSTGNVNLDNEFKEAKGLGELAYIDVPLLFGFQPNEKKFRIELGPQVSFLTSSNLTYENSNGEYTHNVKDQTENLDFGVVGSVGYEMGQARKGKGIFVKLRYYQGFNDVYLDDLVQGTNNGSYFSLHVSLPFITDELAAKNLQKE